MHCSTEGKQQGGQGEAAEVEKRIQRMEGEEEMQRVLEWG